MNINPQELTSLKHNLLLHQLNQQHPIFTSMTTYEIRRKAYFITSTTQYTQIIHSIVTKALNQDTYSFHSTANQEPPHFKIHLDKHLTRAYINQTLYLELTNPLTPQSTIPRGELLNVIAPPIDHHNHRGCTYTVLVEQTGTLNNTLKNQTTPYKTKHLRNSKITWKSTSN